MCFVADKIRADQSKPRFAPDKKMNYESKSVIDPDKNEQPKLFKQLKIKYLDK